MSPANIKVGNAPVSWGVMEVAGATDGATIADGALGSGETVGDWLHAGLIANSAHRQMSNLVFIVIL